MKTNIKEIILLMLGSLFLGLITGLLVGLVITTKKIEKRFQQIEYKTIKQYKIIEL